MKRIPKTTSGKIQRHLLEEGYVRRRVRCGAGRAARTARSATWAGTDRRAPRSRTSSRPSCDAALEGKHVDVHDNLFEVGASSLKLIEIHENIDRDYPGLVDLTELFDFPTIAELALHLEGKLAARG